MKPIFFTKSGLENLKNEQIDLRKKRIAAVTELKRTRELGDLSENGAYRAARNRLSGIDRRLVSIALVLRKSQIIEKPIDGTIGIGSRVTVLQDKEVFSYEIVGGYESNLDQGKISHFSPLGKALIGKKINEIVEFNSPSGSKVLHIKSVL